MTHVDDRQDLPLAVPRELVLQEARAICRTQSSGPPDRPEHLHLRACLALRKGQEAMATAYATRAARAAGPDDAAAAATYHSDLSELLRRRHRVVEAEREALVAVALDGENPTRYRRLGGVLLQRGRTPDAIAAYRTALARDPEHAVGHLELAVALNAHGADSEAVVHYQVAQACRVTAVQAYLGLGLLHLKLGHWQLALDAFGEGVRLDRSNAELHAGVGQAWLALGRVEEARGALADALAIEPRHLGACRSFVCLLERSGSAPALDLAAAWFCFGAALESRNRLREAGIAYRRAVAYRPDCLRALFGAGTVQLQLADYPRAAAYFDTIVQQTPGHRQAHLNRGWTRPAAEDFACGWEEFAWYDRHGVGKRRFFEQPAWDGQPLKGAILLWADQAIGDSIQYLRYARYVRQRASRVIVQCARSLVPLVERQPGVDEVVARRATLPSFDAHAPLTHLPRLFETRLTTVVNDVPYMSVADGLVDEWRQRLGSRAGLRVGLVWGGDPGRKNAASRFTSLTTFAPLARVAGVRFISLQQGLPAIELLSPPDDWPIETFDEESRSLADTAALLANLDLVITVDTMIAHLAGALARPVWTLLPYAPDWRWHWHGPDSAWYPTMRLFRQTGPRRWDGAIEQVRKALVTLTTP